MSDAAAGRGRALVIEGSAGSGKTALLRAAADRAAHHGLELLAARGSQIEQEFPFGLARQLLEPPLSALAAADRDRLLDGPAQPALLAVAPERALDDGAPPEGFAMLHALHLVATGLAQDRPRLLVRGRRTLGRRLVAARPELPGRAPGRRPRWCSPSRSGPPSRARPRTCWTSSGRSRGYCR